MDALTTPDRAVYDLRGTDETAHLERDLPRCPHPETALPHRPAIGTTEEVANHG